MTRWGGRVLILLLALVAMSSIAQAQSSIPDPAYQALRSGNVYVSPGLQGQVNTSTLQSAASGQVKIAMLSGIPNGPWRSRDDYASKLHKALHLGNNALLLVVPPGGRGQGISIYSNAQSDSQWSQLASQYVPQLESNLNSGTAALAQAVGSDVSNPTSTQNTTAGTVASVGNPNQNRGHGGVILGLFFLVVVIGIVILLVSASRRRKQDLVAARGPVEALQSNVLSGIEYIDHYTDVLPSSNPDSEVVRNARQAAETKYEQAAQILAHASSENDLNRAQGILDRAQADIQQARGALDRALGGTANIPGDDAFRPPPMPQNQQQVNAIPQDQRAVSFFSGQPAPLGSLVPVTITVGGQPRQVYATPQEAEELRRGQMPQVRAFNVGGQYVPWYSYNAYDPYRDYWQNQNQGWGGFGSGALAGFVGAELLNDLTRPNYGFGGGYGGYSPYAFSPDFGYDQGYNQGYDQGLVNADQNTGADYGGGADFGGGDQGFNDWSGGDSGGGVDFGGGDFGGGDSGGGVDFGGGGDFGGGSDF
jgi:uncharacterized membrane protein YgcG